MAEPSPADARGNPPLDDGPAQSWAHAALDALPDPVFVFAPVADAEGRVVELLYDFVNAAGLALYGLPAEAVVGHGQLELFPSAAELGIFDAYLRVLSQGEPVRFDVPWFDENGVEGAFSLAAVPLGGRVLVAAQDTTLRLRAERALEESRRDYRRLAESATDIVLRASRDSVLEWVSPSVTRLLGWQPEELVGRRAEDLVHPDDVGGFRAAGEQVLAGLPATYDARFACRSGGHRWMSVRVGPVLDESGAVVGRIGGWRDIQGEVEARQSLERSQARLRSMFDSMIEPHALLGPVRDASGRVVDFRYVDANPQASAYLGIDRARLVGARVLDLWPGSPGQTLVDTCAGWLDSGGPVILDDWAYPRDAPVLDGRFDIRAVPVDDGLLLAWSDVSERHRAATAQAASEELFRGIMRSAPIGMALTDLNGRFSVVNPALARLLGRDEKWLLGHVVGDIVLPEDLEQVRAARDGLRAGQDSWVGQLRLVRAAGSLAWTEVAAVELHNQVDRSDHYLLQVVDVTDEHEARQQLEYQAFHDALTGQRNRAWIIDILELELRTAKRTGAAVGVLFIDLDNFKLVNDSLGHAAGDEVITTASDRIASCLRPADHLGRFGGDEFVVVVPDVTGPDEVEKTAERIVAALEVEMSIHGHRIVPTASIGIAVSTRTSTAESMLRDTDAALFRAKAAGRARWHFFDEQMHAHAMNRLTLEADLRKSLQADDFLVHYQPIVRLDSGAVVGHEALVRWNHPARGLLMPADFLPAAEDSGLVVGVGATVLEQVCAVLASRPDVPTAVSINFSAVQFTRPDWLDAFMRTLQRHDVATSRIVIEVTETAIMSLLSDTRDSLIRARELGVGLHLDDFGTGYSSMALLRQLPVTGLKLDGSFVSALGGDDANANALSRGLAGLVAELGIIGIAECVETKEQADALRAHGWTHAQGYLYGRPGPTPA